MTTRYYTRTVIDHFRNPRNARPMPDAGGQGHAVNPACSDHVRVFVRLDGRTVADASFQAQGCVACIAAASMTTELARGMGVQEALDLGRQAVVDALGGLPASKVECSVIAPRALALAVRDALERGGSASS